MICLFRHGIGIGLGLPPRFEVLPRLCFFWGGGSTAPAFSEATLNQVISFGFAIFRSK